MYEVLSKRFVLFGKASNNRKLFVKISLDIDSDFKLYIFYIVVFVDMGGEEGFSFDEFFLKRKYKKESFRKVIIVG